MSQRVTLDRQSLEQFLAATCLLQQLRQEALGHDVGLSPQPPNDIVGDIYVPGIGVRAALGSDLEETSNFWMAVGEKCAWISQIARVCFRFLFGSMRSARLRILSSISSASEKTRRHANFAAKFPSVANEFLLRGLRYGKSALLKTANDTPTLLRSAAAHIPKLAASPKAAAYRPIKQTGAMRLTRPIVPRDSVHRQMLRAQSLLLGVWKNASLQLRELLRYQPKLPAIRKWTQELHRLETHFSSLSRTTPAPKKSLTNRRYSLDLNGIGRVAPAWTVLLIILLFLIMERGMHRSSQSAAAIAVNTAQASTLPIGRTFPKPQPTRSKIRQAGKSMVRESGHGAANRPFQVSHLQITDPDTDIELRDMTRYEIAKLQKDAQSGDAVAAFQLAMAYEIGYGVPQNCAQAATWVARSAKQGDAAAEYNLGLRYRDGDGVTTNPEEAEKWLRQAAVQKHSEAQLALVALTSHQARAAGSQP